MVNEMGIPIWSNMTICNEFILNKNHKLEQNLCFLNGYWGRGLIGKMNRFVKSMFQTEQADYFQTKENWRKASWIIHTHFVDDVENSNKSR